MLLLQRDLADSIATRLKILYIHLLLEEYFISTSANYEWWQGTCLKAAHSNSDSICGLIIFLNKSLPVFSFNYSRNESQYVLSSCFTHPSANSDLNAIHGLMLWYLIELMGDRGESGSMHWHLEWPNWAHLNMKATLWLHDGRFVTTAISATAQLVLSVLTWALGGRLVRLNWETGEPWEKLQTSRHCPSQLTQWRHRIVNLGPQEGQTNDLTVRTLVSYSRWDTFLCQIK